MNIRPHHDRVPAERIAAVGNSAGVAATPVDEALDAAAQGVSPTSDDGGRLAEDEIARQRETDVIGMAAGLTLPDGEPLGGPDEIERRDAHRRELDPRSAEDSPPGDETS